jgi:Mrp family chromosome partitioning ATPase
MGLKVGVLDADVYGPSMPKLFGLNEKPPGHGGQQHASRRWTGYRSSR